MKKVKTFGVVASAAIIVLVHIAVALADENSWSTGGPYGASVTTIDIHSFDNQRLYIGTVDTGIWQTTDGGADWFLMESDTVRNAIRVVKMHPWGPDTMFAAANKGPFKSTDAGQSWFRLGLPYPLNIYEALEVTRGDPPVIFFGTWGEAFRSTDGGQTWERVDLGVNTDVVTDIKADTQNPCTIYLANSSTIVDVSIFKSTDCGVTWENIHHNISTEDILPKAIDVSPLDPQIIYLSFSNLSDAEGLVLFKSTNGGESWVDISPPEIDPNHKRILDVAASALDVNTVFACLDFQGVMRSTDGGSSWEWINEGVMHPEPATVVTDPATGILYLGLFHGGIYRSTDNGDSWEKISHNLNSAHSTGIAANWRNPDTLYTATTSGLSMSTDGAASWEDIDLYRPYPLFIPARVEVDPYDPSYVYLSCYNYSASPRAGGLYRSTDSGTTWDLFTNGLPPDKGMHRIAVANYGGIRRLFMGSRNSAGLFRSDDLGENWSLCQGGLPPDFDCAAIEVSPVDPYLVLVSDESHNVYESMDGGDSWEPLSNLPGGSLITEIACDPVDPNIIYISVGSSYGLFKSTDGGQSWTDVNNNLPRAFPPGIYISGMAINPLNHDNVFVYSSGSGIFQSHDGGQSWEDFNEGLRIRGLSHVTLIDPTDTSRVFLASYGNSVWEITRTQTGGDCVYTPGDCNHNTIPLELSDVMAMIGMYRGSADPYYICDCGVDPPGAEFAATADPNGNCVPLELGDVVTEIGAYRGTAEASGCEDCPGSRRLEDVGRVFGRGFSKEKPDIFLR